MNVELAVKALLDAAGPVTALVPAVRIYAGRLPQNVAYPALLINTIASSPIDSYPASGTDARIEVRAFSCTRSEVKAVLDAVGPALKRQWGSFGGISVAAIIGPYGGPSLYDDSMEVYHESFDFTVITNP